MEPIIFKSLRELCGYSRLEIAEKFGINLRTVERWESKNRPSDFVVEWITALWAQIVDYANDLMDAAEEYDGITLTRYRCKEDAQAAGEILPWQAHCAALRLVAGMCESAGIPWRMEWHSGHSMTTVRKHT